jgi:hypothetical protein
MALRIKQTSREPSPKISIGEAVQLQMRELRDRCGREEKLVQELQVLKKLLADAENECTDAKRGCRMSSYRHATICSPAYLLVSSFPDTRLPGKSEAHAPFHESRSKKTNVSLPCVIVFIFSFFSGEELARAAQEQLQHDMDGWLQELLHFKVNLAFFHPPSVQERYHEHACRVAELFVG